MSQLVLKHPDLKHEDLKFNTVEVHAGEPRDMYGALIPPIYQTSTFYFDSTDDAVKACDDYAESFAYSRITNPSVDYLEQKLAALEHGKGAVAYASGMGAVSGAIFALLKSGDHAIFTKAKYSGTEDVTSDWLPRFGIAHDTFDAADLSQLEGLIKPNTKLIYVESPANPTMVLVDIAAVVEIAHKHGIKVFIDNTFATPYNTTPLDLGVDAVIHSLTKYIGGHGDLLGGAVISNDEQFLRECRLGTLMHFGSVMAPFTAFLVCRGLKTLGVRMKQYNESALKIAKWLEANPKIETVRYPFLESNPQYAIAKKQMKGGGGMISFDVAGGLEAGKKFINSLKLCTLAVSLGDTETLVEQAAAMTHTMIPKEIREAAGITDGMIRMSVGLEDPDDIIADLKQALGDEYEEVASGASREEIVDTGYERLVYERLDGRFDCPEKITIPEKALGEMSNLTLADGNIKVSPIAICVDTREMQDYPEGYIKRVKISFKDGTEYVVVDENVANHMFAVGHTDRDVTFMFNRMIDVNEIASVILDGDVEFRVS